MKLCSQIKPKFGMPFHVKNIDSLFSHLHVFCLYRIRHHNGKTATKNLSVILPPG